MTKTELGLLLNLLLKLKEDFPIEDESGHDSINLTLLIVVALLGPDEPPDVAR